MLWVANLLERANRILERSELAIGPSCFIRNDLDHQAQAGDLQGSGDVKYKRETTGEHRGRHVDIYRLLAYVVAADLPGGILVYAAGEVEPGTHRVRYLDRTLEIHALDLSRAPEDLLAHVRCLARRIRELAKDVPGARAVL